MLRHTPRFLTLRAAAARQPSQLGPICRASSSSQDGADITLVYFGCRGRADALRAMLHDHAPAFKEQRVVHSEPQEGDALWTFLKPSTPFGGLPVLRVEGVDPGSATLEIGQTSACSLLLGQRFGLLGKTPAEQARCEMVRSAVYSDMVEAHNALLWAPVRQPHAPIDELIDSHLAKQALCVHFLEMQYTTVDGPFLLPSGISVADYFAFSLACLLHETYDATVPAHLAALHNTMMERPAIKAFTEARLQGPYTNSPAEEEVRALLKERLSR